MTTLRILYLNEDNYPKVMIFYYILFQYMFVYLFEEFDHKPQPVFGGRSVRSASVLFTRARRQLAETSAILFPVPVTLVALRESNLQPM